MTSGKTETEKEDSCDTENDPMSNDFREMNNNSSENDTITSHYVSSNVFFLHVQHIFDHFGSPSDLFSSG